MDENKHNDKNGGQKQIAGAIIIAGIVIAGAILLKDNLGSSTSTISASTAKIVGLNVKSFDVCLASGKFKDKVQADIDDGIKAGVSGTPSSFILKDGKIVDTIEGAQPFENIMQQIENISKNEIAPITVDLKPISESDHIIGDKNAKIVIVEYSDLDCPFCKTFHNTMHQVIKQRGEDVAWVYRHYPIPQLHPNAFQKAEETECAWEQKGNEGFWKYTDKLFEITSK